MLKQKMSLKRTTLSFLACLSLYLSQSIFLPIPILAREKQQEKLAYEIKVTMKLIEVYVVDKNGNPVTDLREKDFEIYDKGKIQPIAHFERKSLKLPLIRIPSEETRPKEEIKAQEIKLLPEERRKIFLLFDFGFNTPMGIMRAKEAALHFIDTQLHPTDLVGILSYSSMKGLQMHEYLTEDHKKIREFVKNIGLKDYLGRVRRLKDVFGSSLDIQIPKDLIDTTKETPKGGGGDVIDAGEIERKQDLLRYKHDVSGFNYCLLNLSKALHYIPGYKHIILFSSGVNSKIMYGEKNLYFGEIESREELFGDTLLRSEYENMAKEMGASGSPVYAINTEGLITGRESFRHSTSGDYSLMQFAEMTGGKYFGATNDLGPALEKISEMTSSYYVLGYYIKDQRYDGRYREIKVKVKRKGLEVLTQRGYLNPKPFKDLTKLEKDLHLIELALNEESILQRDVEILNSQNVLFSESRKQYLLTFTEIPIKKDKHKEGKKIEILALLFDREGDISFSQRIEKDFSSSEEESILFKTILPLQEENRVRVIVRDLFSGESAKSSFCIKVPEKEISSLSEPLLLIKGKKSRYLRGFTTEKDKERKGDAYDEEPYPFDPTIYKPLIGDHDPKESPLYASLRYTKENKDASPEMKFSPRLVHLLSGKSMELPSTVIEKNEKENEVIYLLQFNPINLPSGRYSLYILSEDVQSVKRSQTHKLISIK